MVTQYFKCKLKTDIVVNASLATEGNMVTLDFIPGSIFLGLVAGKLYPNSDLSSSELFEIFHSNKVSFGDALIANGNNASYVVPFSLFQDKLNMGLGQNNPTWVHHAVEGIRPSYPNGDFIQLKQQRKGFINGSGDFIKEVEKQFSLKSAHNRKERRSADGKMFGFESIKKGQEFIFSVVFDDEKYVDQVSNVLIGNHRIGKSKTAQYGQVVIEKLNSVNKVPSAKSSNKQLVIYAESNLAFLNACGQSTFQPKPEDFGLDKSCTINWDLSQIRTYSYSSWNGIRNTTNSQRDTIAKGSVIVVDIDDDVSVSNLKTQVGEYTAEGLGRVIYNPAFLKANNTDGKLDFDLKVLKQEKEVLATESISKSTALAQFLYAKNKKQQVTLEIGKAVINVIKNSKYITHSSITKSQWGGIRTIAANAKGMDELINELFAEKTGFLMHGIAAEKIWDTNRGNKRKELKDVIYQNLNLGTEFVERLASDMAKLNKN